MGMFLIDNGMDLNCQKLSEPNSILVLISTKVM